jgi:hypothetical protein
MQGTGDSGVRVDATINAPAMMKIIVYCSL